MRFSTLWLALGASSAMASAIPSHQNCFAARHDELAEYADCGSRAILSQCFANIHSTDNTAALEACYESAGCSASDGAREALYALERCSEMQVLGELRRRHEAILQATPAGAAAATAAATTPDMSVITPAPTLGRRGENAQGDDCFDTKVHTEKICPGFISGTSFPCTMGAVTSKSCRSGWICTEDNNGEDICMTKVDTLDIGGIILAIVFSVIVIAGIGFLITMSCMESRAQKKMKARVEATALARAATKKKRAEEVRAPLMAQQQQHPELEYQSQGGVNPFGDGQTH